MFRSTLRSVSAWWTDFSDDILGADLDPSWDAEYDADPDETAADIGLSHHLDHPHRQQLTSRRERRPGVVPARPAYCLSPVRSRETSNAPHSVVG